jgi:hypothetical protein
MAHNLEFFNTHPFLVTFVMGIVLSMEQQKADINTIRAVRVAAMGPLGGIGDAIFWFTLVPIAAGICSNMAINGSVAGPILFLLIFNAVQFAVRFFLMNWSYKLGSSAIGILTANAKEFTRAASMLGVFIVGALTSNYGGTTVALEIANGESPIVIQSILESLFLCRHEDRSVSGFFGGCPHQVHSYTGDLASIRIDIEHRAPVCRYAHHKFIALCTVCYRRYYRRHERKSHAHKHCQYSFWRLYCLHF